MTKANHDDDNGNDDNGNDSNDNDNGNDGNGNDGNSNDHDGNSNDNDNDNDNINSNSNNNIQAPATANLDTLYFNVTPFRDVRAASSFFSLPFSKELAFDLKLDLDEDREQFKHDIISTGLINYDQAIQMVGLFAKYYGRWVSFASDKPPKELLDSIRLDSPLLLAVCCLMGSIHYVEELNVKSKDLAMDILKEIDTLLSMTVNRVPQRKQLLQSLVILSSFSLSLSYKDVYFDGWYLSGYALLHFITREMDLNLLSDRFRTHPDRINNFRLWNHLSLTHLTFCVLSGRPCLIDTLRIDQCREILDIPSAMSFDGKIVAELSIILSLYNSLQFEEPVEISLKELESTYNDWKYLCEQNPMGEFIQVNYRFSRMMIYRRSFLKDFGRDKGFIFHSPLTLATNAKASASADNDGSFNLENSIGTVRPMIKECIEVINLAYTGDRQELVRSGDTIKFEIFFATITMINMIRLGFGSSPWASKKRQAQVEEAIAKSKKICEWLNEQNNYYNRFVESYYILICKFSDHIHEQEL
ncbi:hypothetical protein FOA43_001950 [Brettanomyces nanus]|uniref:Transcription factor domain-containing protein n=1 Tax=Eeniella nana TaxID=13502 RepID=A0A875S0X8_EENNA|nr:uncharacterized protein FOA43_001950 [Brettanomyces nanus]QPG74618.1 hypothetical protein FOA43_001950 [Brettanomyces nanus]